MLRDRMQSPVRFLAGVAFGLVLLAVSVALAQDVTLSRDGTAVHKRGAETIADVKTFSSQPVMSAGVSIATGQKYTGAGTVTLDSVGALTIGSASTTAIIAGKSGLNIYNPGGLIADESSQFTSDLDVRGILRNLGAGNGGTVGISDASGLRFVQTGVSAIIESATAATGGTDTAFTIRPTAALAAGDIIVDFTDASSTSRLTVAVDGTTTFKGPPIFSSVASTATGTSSFDLSGGSGVFKTSTGAVTVGPGAVTVSGATTFSAAGTALTVTNNTLLSGTLSVTGAVTIGASGTAISKSLRVTQVADLASTAISACAADVLVSLTGAETGAECIVGAPAAATAGWLFDCYVSSVNTVQLRGCNVGGANPSDPASATYSVRVFNP